MTRHRPEASDDEYEIFARYVPFHGRYLGGLKVVRKADRRVLYPFDGAPPIGPFGSPEEARKAAIELGWALVRSDRESPER